MSFDGKAFGTEIVSAVKAHIFDVLAPIVARLEAIETRHAAYASAADGAVSAIRSELEALGKTVADIPEPWSRDDIEGTARDAVKAAMAVVPTEAHIKQFVADAVATQTPALTLDDVGPYVSEKVKAVAAAIPTGDQIKAIAAEEAQSAIAALPPAEPDKSVTVEDVAPMIAERVGEAVKAAVEAIPPVEPEKVDREEVAALVKSEAERILATWGKPEDGKSVTVDDVAPMIAEQVAKAFSAIPVPKDGCGVKDVIIDREGSLVFTMDDGRMKNLGLVVGQDCDMEAVGARIKSMFDEWPKPQDGVGFDEMDLEFRGDGTFIVFTRGDVVKEARLPFPHYREVWKEGETYHKGSVVTWGGSAWIAKADTTTKPDAPGSDWRLAVKKGRDAKDIDKAAVEAIVKSVIASQKKRGD